MGIDFSNEGLATRVMDADPSAMASGDTAGETTGTDGGHVDDAEQRVEEVAVEATDTAQEAEAVEQGQVQEQGNEDQGGTDPEEETYRQRYENLVSKLGQQGQELGEYRQMKAEFEQLKAHLAQQQAQPQQPEPAFQSPQPRTVEELFDMAAEPAYARAAYDFAVARAPELLADVIAEVAFHDPAEANRMQLEYVQSMLEQNLQPVQNIEERINRVDEEVAAQRAVDEYAQSVDGWAEIKDDVADIVEQEPWLMGNGSQEEVMRGLRAATRMAQQARRAEQQAQQQAQAAAAAQRQLQSQQVRQEASVESGTPASAPPVEDPSIADSIRAGIFADDERVRRARNF